MPRARVLCALVLFAAIACRHQPDDESIALGAIEFFGYKELDVDAVRAALPVHEGARIDEPSDALNRRIADAVVKTVGRAPTDISFVCCDEKQRVMVYIGLPGATVKPFA